MTPAVRHMPGMALDGGALTHEYHCLMSSSTPARHAAKITYRTQYCTACGSATCHSVTPINSTQLIGSRYFKQVIITWSMRSRGSVQRTHIITNTRNQHLKMNTNTLRTLP